MVMKTSNFTFLCEVKLTEKKHYISMAKALELNVSVETCGKKSIETLKMLISRNS